MFLREIRYAIRSLSLSKGFAIVGILCLGLGIGINTAVFSIVDGVFLKAYPFDDPDRIVVLESERLKNGEQSGLSVADLRDWKAATSLTTIAGTQSGSMTVVDGAGEPERYNGARISWDLFTLLGVHPIIGRDFLESDDQPNAAGVVVISHMLWTIRYSADPQVLGRSVTINGAPHTIVGVMPPNFAFPENHRLWIPLQPTLFKDPRDRRYLFSFARLQAGVTTERALSELNTIAARLANDYPATNEGWRATIRTLHDAFVPDEATLILGLMMGGVTLVLFIACSNVANLLLARATARRHELAMRVALGASRRRIVLQLLTESVILALASVPLGVLVAIAGIRVLWTQIPADGIPYYIQFSVDGRATVYAVALAFATSLVFGLVPALQITRHELQENLKEGARGSAGRGALVRNALVVSQVSLALVGLVGALLFVRSFTNLDNSRVGFDTSSVLSLRFFMSGEPYNPKGAKALRVEDIVRRVEALPGVQSAFASNLVPIGGGGSAPTIEVEGRATDARHEIVLISTTPHLFSTLGVPVRRGRDLTDTDSNRPVAVINESMATRLWPGGNATDRRFRIVDPAGTPEWFTVIGIAPDLHLWGVDPNNAHVPITAFAPYQYGEFANTGITIRMTGDPATLTRAVRDTIRQSDPNLPLFNVRTLEEARQREYWQFALYGWIFGVIGVIGVLLASIGVYGVLAYSVSQRTREIGVRVTLGAGTRQVLTLIVGQGLALTMTGVVIGLVLAAFGTPLTRSLLYNVSPFDPFSFVAVSLLLVAVALMASYVPARRAMKVDPVVALRQE